METLALALAWAGPLAVAVAWASVRLRGASIWTAMGWTVGPLGLLAVLTGEVRAGGEVGVAVAFALGIGAGVALYVATAAFMRVFRRWPLLVRHARGVYAWREGLPVGAVLAVACLVVAPGEEALWRGVVQGRLEEAVGGIPAAAIGWAAYVAANAVSGSVPIVLGAVVGGVAWTGLAMWTGGVVASILCHLVWTGLMIVRPPVPGRAAT